MGSDKTAHDWFLQGYAQAARADLRSAEESLITALELEKEYILSWLCLSAVLLAQGRETDGEKAGKAVLELCPQLKMTWTQLRGNIKSYGIRKGASWKLPKRVTLDNTDSAQWTEIITRVRECSKPELRSIPDVANLPEVEEEIEEQESSYFMDEEEIMNLDEEAEEENVDEEEPEPEEELDQRASALPAKKWFGIADAYLMSKQYQLAEKAYIRGLALDAENGVAWLRLGTLLMKRGALDEAEDALRLATKSEPRNPYTWIELAKCLHARKMWKEANVVIRQAMEIDPSLTEIWYLQGLSDFMNQAYREAARSFLRVLRKEPNHVEALFYLGKSMQRRGNVKHALSIYHKILNLPVDDAKLLDELSTTLYRLGREQEGLEAKRKANLLRRQQEPRT